MTDQSSSMSDHTAVQDEQTLAMNETLDIADDVSTENLISSSDDDVSDNVQQAPDPTFGLTESVQKSNTSTSGLINPGQHVEGPAPFDIIKKNGSKETLADPEMHSPELQLCRHKSDIKKTTVIDGANEVTRMGKSDQDETVMSAENRLPEAEEVFHDCQPHIKEMGSSGGEEVGRQDSSLGDDIIANQGAQHLATPILQQPLVLTASPRIPHLPIAVNPAEVVNPAFTALPPAEPNPQPSTRPVFRRLGSNRPPPSTPPEPVTQARLSMPTLPSLHQTSVPVLIEQYRVERRSDPTAFDNHTTAIKQSLIQAKVERGGEAVLLINEYTAELASRLDASVIEGWSAVRRHEEHAAYPDSEYDDEDAVYRIPDEVDATEPAPPTTYNDFLALDRAHLPTAPGTIVHTTRMIREELNTGAEVRTYETTIKITRVVEVPAVTEDTALAAEAGMAATGADGLEGILTRLAVLRADRGEVVSEELLEILEEVKMRLEAMRRAE